jgi:hypothetical protein
MEESDERGDVESTRGGELTTSGGRFIFGQAWMAVACALLFTAAILLYLGRSNAAFVVAALGVSAWFLNVRTNLKRTHNLVKRGGRNWEPKGDEEDDEDEDNND